MASSPIASWQILREGGSGIRDRFYFLGLQNHCWWWLLPHGQRLQFTGSKRVRQTEGLSTARSTFVILSGKQNPEGLMCSFMKYVLRFEAVTIIHKPSFPVIRIQRSGNQGAGVALLMNIPKGSLKFYSFFWNFKSGSVGQCKVLISLSDKLLRK